MDFGRLARGAAWTAVAGAVLVLGLWLVVVSINCNDEAPSADALRLQRLIDERPVIADDANAYVLMFGLGVPADADPLAWGVRRKAFLDAFPAGTGTTDASALPGDEYAFEQRRTPSTKTLMGACREANRACVSHLQEHPEAIDAWLDSEHWLLERYLRLIGLTQWRESIPTAAEAVFPPYLPAMDGQRMLLMQAWRHARRGESDAARELMQRDLVFWRMVLRASDTLISKMVASAAIRRHFAMGNLVLRELAHVGADASPPVSWNAPIDRAERSMHRAFAGEWLFSKGAVESSFETDGQDALMRNRLYGWALAPMFKREATSNLFAANMVRLSDGLDVEPDKLPAAMLEMMRHPERGLRSLYNPVGQILGEIGYDSYPSYAARVSDLEGARRAALLTLELRRNASGDARAMVERVLDSTWGEPYSGAPFDWDEAAGSIVYDGLQPRPHGRHAMLL